MLTALLALALAAPAAPPKEKEKEPALSDAAKKDLKKLEGDWKATKLAREGKEEESPMMGGEEVVITFKGRMMLMNGKDFMAVTGLDPSTDPKCIDFKAVIDHGPVTKGTPFEMIYKVDGDTLVLALHPEGGTNRPAKFEAPADSKVMVVTFQKQKK
jgi:uncharacterized protein (TIGR03067 family)